MRREAHSAIFAEKGSQQSECFVTCQQHFPPKKAKSPNGKVAARREVCCAALPGRDHHVVHFCGPPSLCHRCPCAVSLCFCCSLKKEWWQQEVQSPKGLFMPLLWSSWKVSSRDLTNLMLVSACSSGPWNLAMLPADERVNTAHLHGDARALRLMKVSRVLRSSTKTETPSKLLRLKALTLTKRLDDQ